MICSYALESTYFSEFRYWVFVAEVSVNFRFTTLSAMLHCGLADLSTCVKSKAPEIRDSRASIFAFIP